MFIENEKVNRLSICSKGPVLNSMWYGNTNYLIKYIDYIL